MDAGRDGPPTFVKILEDADGSAWIRVQLPTGSLLRGPYSDLQEVQSAAAALERVARRRWAQDGGEATQMGSGIGGPAPHAPITGHPGKESPSGTPTRPRGCRFPSIFADFLRNST